MIPQGARTHDKHLILNGRTRAHAHSNTGLWYVRARAEMKISGNLLKFSEIFSLDQELMKFHMKFHEGERCRGAAA